MRLPTPMTHRPGNHRAGDQPAPDSRRARSLARLQRSWCGRHPLMIASGGLLLMWCWAALGPGLPYLLTFLAVLVVLGWIVRRRRDILASLVIVAAAVAGPGVLLVIEASHHAALVNASAAVLTGYMLAAPIPTLFAWTGRPVVTSRPIGSLLGTAVLLASAAPVAIWGDHGDGTTFLVAGLVGGVGVVWVRHRRAVSRRIDAALATAARRSWDLADGWCDLGTRMLPDGEKVHLLLGAGNVVAAHRVTSSVGDGQARRAVRRSIALAAALRTSPTRIQPVLLDDNQAGEQARHVTVVEASATVVYTAPSGLSALTAAAPRRRGHRRLLATASALPTLWEGHQP